MVSERVRFHENKNGGLADGEPRKEIKQNWFLKRPLAENPEHDGCKEVQQIGPERRGPGWAHTRPSRSALQVQDSIGV